MRESRKFQSEFDKCLQMRTKLVNEIKQMNTFLGKRSCPHGPQVLRQEHKALVPSDELLLESVQVYQYVRLLALLNINAFAKWDTLLQIQSGTMYYIVATWMV